MASGCHQQEIAPGGCSHAIFLKLHYHSPSPSKKQILYQHRGSLRTQLVTARDDLLTIYDVYERPASKKYPSSGSGSGAQHRLVVARRHNLFGTVTGLQRVETLASDKDGRDRLLVSFCDAKLALLEWNDATDDLETVSIHTYERAPQLLNGTPNLFQPNLNVDPLSRCAALLLPHDALAILPFYRDAADFDFDDDLGFDLGKDKTDAATMAAAVEMEGLPYAPSFVLTMREVDANIRNLKDFCFMPGFQKPTVAVLFSHTPTWTGLLAERKDTFSVYLFTLDLSASLDGATIVSSADGLDDGTVRTAHPVVTTSSQLPYDCLYMVPCPQTLGGVLVVCMSSILHVDQSGRVVVTAINKWFKTISGIEAESVLEVAGIADLQASQLVFTSETEGVLTLVNGDIYRFRCQMDGRSVEGIRLDRMEQSLSTMQEELVAASGPPPSCLAIAPATWTPKPSSRKDANASAGYLFTASMAGDSALYDLALIKRPLSEQERAEAIKQEPASTTLNGNDMDLDYDDDLYGASDAAAGAAKAKGANKDKTVLTVRKVDDIRSHGGFHSIARRKLPQDEPGSSKRYGLVGACGSGNQAGLVYLDPRFVPQDRTKLAAAAADNDVAPTFDRVFVVGRDGAKGVRMIASNSQDATSLAFTSRCEVSTRTSLHQQATWTDVVPFSGSTLSACQLAGGDVVARVTRDKLQALAFDTLEVVHEVELPSAADASIDANEYAVLLTVDGGLRLFHFNAEQREWIQPELFSEDQHAQLISANVFRDTFGVLDQIVPAGAKGQSRQAVQSKPVTFAKDEDEEVDYGEDDLSAPTGANGKATQASRVDLPPAYLFTYDQAGVMRIRTLPELRLIWQNHCLNVQPQRLRYESGRNYELVEGQTATTGAAVACHIGDMLSVVSLTQDNFLTVYKANIWASKEEVEATQKDAGKDAAQRLAFNKCMVQLLTAPAGGARSNAEHSRWTTLQLEVFSLASRDAHSAQGVTPNAVAVFGGGKEASASVLCWTAEGGYRLLDWAAGDISSLSSIPPCSVAGSAPSELEAEYVYSDRSGNVFLGRCPSGLYSSTSWMSSVVRTGREYTRVVSHTLTTTVIAASMQPNRFVLFDDDGEPIGTGSEEESSFEESDPSLGRRGALELFVDQDKTSAIDGYEFEANETVSALEIVTLDAPSTESGAKQFVAVGTTTFHGEDRTAKGSVYLFEVIEVVASKYQIGRDYRLKLVCRDDSRAPVTAIAHLNGLLVSTCGQKLYVRAFEKEEWLISVAFVDCPFYVTSIRVVKNLVLLSDAKRSLWLLAFQEEPYKFIPLGRDINDQNATLGEYLVYNEKLSLVSTSGDALGGFKGFGSGKGVIRLYEYAPHVATSLGGQRLLLRTEFQTPSEAVASTMCRGRWLSDSELRGREEGRNRLLLAKASGALESVSSMDDKVAKRLHVLQGQLVRSVQHTAALNARAFRAVRNDFVSRALNKGILDARLLDTFLHLSRPKMLEVVKTLSGMWDGMDVIKPKRKRQAPDEANGDDDHHQPQENTEDQDELDLGQHEALRIKSDEKRVQLVLKDLLRLRLGFEQV